jgi:hypothetical protein
VKLSPTSNDGHPVIVMDVRARLTGVLPDDGLYVPRCSRGDSELVRGTYYYSIEIYSSDIHLSLLVFH